MQSAGICFYGNAYEAVQYGVTESWIRRIKCPFEVSWDIF